jgi:hypothetical protein
LHNAKGNPLYDVVTDTDGLTYNPSREALEGNDELALQSGTPGGYDSNVISETLNRNNVTYGLAYNSNGSFHVVIRINSITFYRIVAHYLLVSLSSTIFASLSFNITSRNHNINGDYVYERTYLIARHLFRTGALAGYSKRRVLDHYARFNLTFTCSRGGGNAQAEQHAGERLGCSYYKWAVGPFKLEDLIGDIPASQLNVMATRFKDTISEHMMRKLENAEDFGVSEGSDNSDIGDFIGFDEYASRSDEARLTYRAELFRRRLDEVTIKLLPRNFLTPMAMTVRPINYASSVIPLATTRVSDMPFVEPYGDAVDAQLDNVYNEQDPDNRQFLNLNATTAQLSHDKPLAPMAEISNTYTIIRSTTENYNNLNEIEPGDMDTYNWSLNVNPSSLTLNDATPFITPERPLLLDPNSAETHNQFFQLSGDIEFEYGSDMEERYAGCLVDPKDRLEAYFLRLTNMWAPPFDLEDNNCVPRCYFQAKGWEPTDKLIADMRDRLEMTTDEHFTPTTLRELAGLNNEVFHLWEIVKSDYAPVAEYPELKECKISKMFRKFDTVTPRGGDELLKRERRHFHFLWHKHHCYLIKDPKFVVDKVKCSKCTQWIKLGSFKNHYEKCFYCPTCRKAYSVKNGSHNCGGERLLPKESIKLSQSLAEPKVCEDWVQTKKFIKTKKLTPADKIWLADIETFPNAEDRFNCCAYAIGLQCLATGSKYMQFWGPTCVPDFLAYTQTISGTLYFFNGGRFDAYVVINGMVNHGYPLETSSFIKNKGTIMNFNLHAQLRVHDLYLYIDCGLAKACKAWGVPADEAKGEFKHAKIYDFESAERHKEEVQKYLKLDVVALRSLYDIYSKAQFECFGVDINRAISLSEYAYNVWSAECGVTHLTFVPHTGKEEDDDRAAYYGGRVTPQRKEYVSSQYVEGQKEYDYAQIDDHLIYPDVNSLYPAVCKKFRYAIGHWRYMEQEEIERLDLVNRLNNQDDPDENNPLFRRCCWKVTISCPKDLITAFLVERLPSGKLVHTLDTKVEQWYWGNELEEAILLGYDVLSVHEVKVFPYYAQVFDTFVDKCCQGRLDNPKPSVKNRAFKDTLNKLTGKFGQKSHPYNTVIYNTGAKQNEKQLKAFEESIATLNDFDIIFSNSGKNHAIVMEVANPKPHPTYPIYLSAQILANSRVYMSGIYEKLNAYRDPNYAIYYTDTDSMVLHARCQPILERAGLIGEGLGQLSCDLIEPYNGHFAKILTGVWAAPKGPYALGYVDNKKPQIMEKVKAKGMSL